MENDVNPQVPTEESQKTSPSKKQCDASSDDSDYEDSDLKEVMQLEDAGSSFFQRYFQNHSNSLPSRLMGQSARRLSQCREEDEDDEKKDQTATVPLPNKLAISDSDKSLSESRSSSKTSVIDTVTGTSHTFFVSKAKEDTMEVVKDDVTDNNTSSSDNSTFSSDASKKRHMSEVAKIFASRRNYRQSNTVGAVPSQSNRMAAYSIFGNKSPIASPHYDTKFFDSSLIEIKTSSTSTVDAIEDIWIKRPESEKNKELGSQPLPTISGSDEAESLPRPRSGTWGAKETKKDKNKLKKTDKAVADGRKREKVQSGSRSGSTSRSNSAERRKSDDASPKKEGSRSRSNSDASKRKGSAFMASMKAAMLHTGLIHVKQTKAPKDGSAHPVLAPDSSDTRYYHTVTAAATNRGPMTKVMDIFRNKPTFQSEEEIIRRDERKEDRKKEERREEERRRKEEKERKREEDKKKKEKHAAFLQGRPKGPRDGSAHPVRDSDNMYYHTVTAASSSRSPMTKVMDIFRNRTHASVPPDERRKKANQHLGK